MQSALRVTKIKLKHLQKPVVILILHLSFIFLMLSLKCYRFFVTFQKTIVQKPARDKR